jgi:hypothetical protein
VPGEAIGRIGHATVTQPNNMSDPADLINREIEALHAAASLARPPSRLSKSHFQEE